MAEPRRYLSAAFALLLTVVAGAAHGATNYTVKLSPPTRTIWPYIYDVESPFIVGTQYSGFVYNYLTGEVVELTPPGMEISSASGVWANQQVGSVSSTSRSTVAYATLWSGTAASAVNLHPVGYVSSWAQGIHGSTQVGAASPQGSQPFEVHAMLWHGSADSAVDLHPPGFLQSAGTGVWGDTQVGHATHVEGSVYSHALLWHGSADSVVDLHPAGYSDSKALGATDGVQVGYGTLNSHNHAVLWRGTAGSAVDLHPAWADPTGSSEALAAAGNVQVGVAGGGSAPDFGHAIVWQGTAASAIDLHDFLKPSDFASVFPGDSIYVRYSRATGVDANGVIVGNVEISGARYGTTRVGVRWIPVVPEPAAHCLAFAALMAILTQALSKHR